VFSVKLRQQFVTDAPIGKDVVETLKSFHYLKSKRDKNMRITRVQMPYARVLLVDDMATNLDVAKGMLKPYAMRVDSVTSGPQAIEVIRKGKVKYNAIFMDHMMPEMDGIEATKLIRQLGTDYAKNIPIIALTANVVSGNEQMFLDNGFQALLAKPIEIPRLDAIVRKWIRNRHLEKKTQTQNHALKPKARLKGLTAKGIDLRAGLERFNGDEDAYLNVLRSYADNTPPLIAPLKNVNERSLGNYAIIVHGIKSSSRAISAEAIGDMAEALESAAKAGNLICVREQGPPFIEALNGLLNNVNKLLSDVAAQNPKPKRDKIDEQLLSDMFEACENYDMDGADDAMTQIEAFEYTSDGGLAKLLRENLESMNFNKIKNALSVILKKEPRQGEDK
ncbi:MAG: response regulator, partial [Elusimicrobiota bacterium]|nr:response regulator [Elusimicrobiota bacterium]